MARVDSAGEEATVVEV